MRTFQLPIEYCVFLADPNNPKRPPAHHIAVATYIDMEDGSPVFEVESKRRTMSPAMCKREDIPWPDAVGRFNQLAVQAAEEKTAECDRLCKQAELDAAALAEAEATISRLLAASLVTVTTAPAKPLLNQVTFGLLGN